MTHDAPQHKVEDAEAFVAKIKADAAAERERRQKLEAEHPPIELLRRLANPANPYPKKSPLVGKAIPVEADRLEAEAAYEELKKPKTKEEPKPKADGQRSKAQAKVLAQVEALNEKHFVVNNVGGKCLIGEFVPSSIDPKRTVLSWQSPHAFMTRYGNQKVGVVQEDTTTAYKDLGWYWLKHRDRRSYEGIELVPNGPAILPGNRLNLWRGFGVTPKKGNWSLIRKHIKEVLADGDPKADDYIIRWVAWGFQHPDELPLVALVLIGLKGRGKGTFARVLEIIYGNHALQISSQRHIVGNFNAHLENLVLMISDEAYWAGHKADAGSLQRIITEPTLAIEAKGCDVRNVKNYIRLLMLAEPGWSVPAGQDERRYAIFDVSKEAHDETYFKALYREIDNRGPAAMLYDLQQLASPTSL
jgi:uncharacterized protein DUF5906